MRRLPIWFILGMLSVFFVGTPLFAQDATLAIGSGAGTPGSTFTVPISMNNSVEVQGLQFVVTDERDVVDVESLTRSDRLTSRGFTLSSNSVSPTRTNVVIIKIGTPGLPSGTGTIVEVSFRVRDGVFNGTYPIKLTGVMLSDAVPNTISSGTVDGTITVTGGQERDLTPTGITLAAFTAASDRGMVTIDWRMGSGQEVSGFHVLRSLTATGGFERISTDIITADEEGYTYLDRDVRPNVTYHYMLESATTGELFGPLAVRVDPPGQFSLSQNAPNPFNPTTSIRYELPNTVQVTLKVYNLLGQEVRLLVNARQEAGFHTIIWDGRNVAGRSVSSGVYFYRIEAGEFTKAKKMLLLK